MNFDDGLPRISPGEAGVDPRAVLDFIDRVFAKDLQLHSFMLYRGGHVVAEGWSWPYQKHRPHMMHSLTKSVTACGVGIAIDEGYFSLDDKKQLDEIQRAAVNNDNVFEHMMEACKVCSIGQITNALFEVGGQYRRSM